MRDLAVELAAISGELRRPARPPTYLSNSFGLHRLGRPAQPSRHDLDQLVERPRLVAGVAQPEVEAQAVIGGVLDGLVVTLVPRAPLRTGVGVGPVAQVADAQLLEAVDEQRPVAVRGAVVDDVGGHADRVAEGLRAPRLHAVRRMGGRAGERRQQAARRGSEPRQAEGTHEIASASAARPQAPRRARGRMIGPRLPACSSSACPDREPRGVEPPEPIGNLIDTWYFGRALEAMAREVEADRLTVYLTFDTEILPSYGDDVA